MSLKKLLCLGALVSGFTLAGCSVLQSDELTSCTTDEACSDDSLCHPLAKVCVKSCESATDCPSSAKSCSGVSTASGSERKFCECQSTELCGDDEDVICTDEEKICAPKCTNDVDCTAGRRCDTSTGNCRTN
ncbi:hypothetical protein [Hyalangium rubrum]|uniref:Lipoprotein n=1 Tax=Hyalangium rubrum TaxID=3103134 RepID=A0ABU5H9F0_9BACT|nr:hypothetical protein [Hyalangium sp. s54d21]MDY7228730.1 hypothetical protein [Hyalangium sp. s54d21]